MRVRSLYPINCQSQDQMLAQNYFVYYRQNTYPKGTSPPPEFSWESNSQFRIAPTSIAFLDSDRFGERYENDMFVGDVHGNIYHFKLDTDRTKLLLVGPVADEVANDSSEIEDLIFAKFPGVVTDLKVGPDGYLYVLLYDRGELLRIVPSSQESTFAG